MIEVNQTPYYGTHARTLEWKGSGQPAFHKEFKLLADHLKSNTRAGISNYVFSPNDKQILRLEEIFEEIDKEVKFTGIQGEFHEGFLDQASPYRLLYRSPGFLTATIGLKPGPVPNALRL